MRLHIRLDVQFWGKHLIPLALLIGGCSSNEASKGGDGTGSSVANGGSEPAGNQGYVGGAGGDGGIADPIPLTAYAVVPTQQQLVAEMHEARADHQAVRTDDGRVVVIGGELVDAERTMIATVEVYDPKADSWTSLEDLPEARAMHTATLLLDGRILVVGGGRPNATGQPSGLDVATTAVLIDPVSDTREVIVGTATPRHAHATVLLSSGKVLVIGGASNESTVKPSQGTQNPQPFGNVTATAEIFDPATNLFYPTGSLNQGRWHLTATLMDNSEVLVCGGAAYDNPNAESFDSCEVYSELTGEFRPGPALDGHDRHFHAAVRLLNGDVMLAAGKKANTAFLDDVQILDATSLVWSKASGEVHSGRTSGRLVPMRDGGALFVGGLSCTAGGCLYPKESDLISSTGEQSDGPSLKYGRFAAETTILLDGSILVTGGGRASGATVKVERLY
jgi:hypothetical protein